MSGMVEEVLMVVRVVGWGVVVAAAWCLRWGVGEWALMLCVIKIHGGGRERDLIRRLRWIPTTYLIARHGHRRCNSGLCTIAQTRRHLAICSLRMRLRGRLKPQQWW